MRRADLFRLTLERVEELAELGVVSWPELRLYRLLWSWCAWRLGGEAGAAQDRFRRRCGQEALDRRRARAQAWAARLARES